MKKYLMMLCLLIACVAVMGAKGCGQSDEGTDKGQMMEDSMDDSMDDSMSDSQHMMDDSGEEDPPSEE